MLEILQFIFSSFWIFLGITILLGWTLRGLVLILLIITRTIRPRLNKDN